MVVLKKEFAVRILHVIIDTSNTFLLCSDVLRRVEWGRVRKALWWSLRKSLRSVFCTLLSTLQIFSCFALRRVRLSGFTVRTVRRVRKALWWSLRKSLRSVFCTLLSTLQIFSCFSLRRVEWLYGPYSWYGP